MTSELVMPLRLAASRRELAGGKAAALGACLDAGLPAVPGFVVTTEAFRRALDAAWLAPGIAASEGFAERVRGLPLPPDLRKAVDQSLESLLREMSAAGDTGGSEAVFAVRSSTPEEDAGAHSFAGQFESFLCVRKDQVPEKIAAVWASAFSERAAAYRKERGITQPPSAPAVLVQPMIAAEASGVVFSADPVTARRRVAVVSGTWGLGLKVVSGEAPADTWRVSREGKVVERVIARKPSAYRVAAAGPAAEDAHTEEAEPPEARKKAGSSPAPAPARPGDLIETEIDPVEAELPSLSDPQAVALARLAWRCEDAFGGPQDAEWALAGGRIWLLQTRPVTSLAGKADPDSARALWDNSNIGESYTGVTTPLTFTFARHVYAHVYREFCRILRVPEKRIEASGEVFDGMLGFVKGRIYYNLANWHRVLAMLPGYVFNARFMEQMMGVRAPLPERHRPKADTSAGFAARAADFLRLAASAAALIWAYLTFNRCAARFQARLNAALDLGGVPLERMDAPELLACYRDLERRLLRRWDAPILNDFFAMIFSGLLGRVCAKWFPEENGSLPARLIASHAPSAGAEPARLIQQMGAALAGQKELLAMWREGAPEAVRAAAAVPDLAEALRVYLDRFGDRCFNELKLETPSLRVQPAPLLRAAARAALAPRVDTNCEALRAQNSCERLIFHRMRHHTGRVLALKWLLRGARRHLRLREELRLERTRLFGRVRRIFFLIGRQLKAAGCLPSADDIFFLTLEEVTGAVTGTSPASCLAELAALRKTEFERNKSEAPPPDRFETCGPVCQGLVEACETAPAKEKPVERNGARRSHRKGPGASGKAAKESECVLQGTASSPGKARARARVVLDPASDSIEHGEILVARHTDPGWVMLFPGAAGILVERGSLLSHASIVARELGLPAVVGISGLLEKVRTGDLIEMDGETGVVRLLDCSLQGRKKA